MNEEAKHWKAKHDNMVKRNALLLERPDLPVDRIPAHKELIRLQNIIEEIQEAMEKYDNCDDPRQLANLAGPHAYFIFTVRRALKG